MLFNFFILFIQATKTIIKNRAFVRVVRSSCWGHSDELIESIRMCLLTLIIFLGMSLERSPFYDRGRFYIFVPCSGWII